MGPSAPINSSKNSVNAGSSGWGRLLGQLDADALTEDFITRVLTVSAYANAPLPVSEIRRTGAESFTALIAALGRDDDTEQDWADRESIATDVGISRARAGVPIESLMTAIRLDFSVLWQALTEIATAADAAVLVAHTARMWQVVDSYAGQTQAAYVAEQQRMHDEAFSVRQGLVAALFGETDASEGMLAHIAEELGVRMAASFSVAVAVGTEAPKLRVALAAARAGDIVFTHHLGDALVAFWVFDSRAGSVGSRVADHVSVLRCGLAGPTAGLASVRSSVRFARSLASLLQPDENGSMTWARGWARLVRLRLDESGAPVIADVDAALARCGMTERQRLAEAARSFLETGSVAASAEQLYCHRNTVMNRLRRFAEITGIDVTVPKEAAQLVVGWA